MARRFSQFWTFLASDRLGWARLLAALIGVTIVSNWLQWPLKTRQAFPFFWVLVAIWGVWRLASWQRVEDWLGRVNLDDTGAWRTTRADRIRRLGPLVILCCGLEPLLRLSWELWLIGDLLRVAVSLSIAAGLLATMVSYAWRTWRSRVELRIDATGVFAPSWRRTYAWDEIAFAVQPSRSRELRLALTDEAAEAAGRGALLTVALPPTGLFPDEALAALRAFRPELPIRPWISNGVVLPIRGATDLPDVGKVETYG
ncbi:hypothetical protein [Caulobacter sp. BP25]|uniref:hypothetical protein n=1 Tax=Caulobacter sp. BP25 TaxID=2048900 RepID=UPI000C12BAA6|nr:hypothetical protein [Caulobacter sp. BP25]PHY21172.1 hypothetical protein CSW59_05295 [Caulobacter sp. BP25]